MGLYTTSDQDLYLTGLRQTDVVTDARPGHSDQEMVVLFIDQDTRTVKTCNITPKGLPGKRTFIYQPEDLRLISRTG
jgi:hypothetical protein